MTEASAKQTILKTITAIMLLMNCGTAAASEVDDAIELVLTGDKAWDDTYSNVIALKDCKTSYTRTIVGLKLYVLVDWNNVIWNSGSYVYNGGAFTLGCKGVCSTKKLESYSPASEQQIVLPVTAQERFENALKVIASECPGVSTRF
jgi:hypothetical protein